MTRRRDRRSPSGQATLFPDPRPEAHHQALADRYPLEFRRLRAHLFEIFAQAGFSAEKADLVYRDTRNCVSGTIPDVRIEVQLRVSLRGGPAAEIHAATGRGTPDAVNVTVDVR